MTPNTTTRILLALLLILGLATVANAQATRTWVSGVGDDANPCSRTAPCKTFAGAISKTAAGGEISVLDPGGFGAVTITKAITINGEGTLASILNAGSNGISVNVVTNPATAVVFIHNLSINGAQSGINGISYTAGNTLVVDHCWIYGQTNAGINVNGTGDLHLKVNETQIEHITGAGNAITIDTSAGQVVAMISRCYLQDAANGLEVKRNGRIGIESTVISNHTGSGIKTTGNDSTVNADDLFITFCATGLKSNNAGTASHIRISDSVITQVGTGIDVSLGGTIDSFQGNSLIGNGVDGAFTTTTGKQ